MRRVDHRRRSAAVLGIAALIVAFVAHRAAAAGPLIVNGAGDPLVWSSGVVQWNPDRGSLGSLSNADAVQFVGDNFGKWQAVATATLAISNTGALPVDVTAANVSTFVGICGDGLSPIVFDDDGSITDALLGAGASNSVLGFAGPECGTLVPPVITEAAAILNGKFVDGIANAANPEISITSFGAVFLHEFGHYLNLDHSQINLVEAFDHDVSNDDTIATMFPFLVNGTAEATLARDDQVAISMLYPSAAFGTAFGRITGSILWSNGTTPFQGAYVIARNVADPRHDAIGYASGARFVPGASGGPPPPELQGTYELPGLQPGARYTVEVEPIYPGFTGGSSVGPFSTPVALPGPPEFWNGANEAATNPPDDPDAPGTPIVAAAGTTAGGVDIVLNGTVPPSNDACVDATAITFPFDDTESTSGATSAAADPVQDCTGGTTTANSNSVWYRFTAPTDGTVVVSTEGSDYDTVLSAYTGTCDALAAVACADDIAADTNVQSVIGFAVSGGTAYLVEVTQYGTNGGGTLHLTAVFTPNPPAPCDLPAPGACIPGGGKPSHDCATEWLVEPVPAIDHPKIPRRNVPLARLACHDGDPSCDLDGVGKDGGCMFHVAVCVNNADPRAATAGCAATSIASYLVQRPSAKRPRDATDAANAAALRDAVAALASPGESIVAGGLVSFIPPQSSVSRCTPFQNIRVPIGTRVLQTRATTITGAKDTDFLSLRCVRAATR
jgi:hypothetical protein